MMSLLLEWDKGLVVAMRSELDTRVRECPNLLVMTYRKHKTGHPETVLFEEG